MIKKMRRLLFICLVIIFSVSCSGGGGGDDDGGGDGTVGTGIRGVASTHVALVNKPMLLKDRDGEQLSVTTSESGNYIFDDVKDLTEPFVIRTETNDNRFIYSIVAQPEKGIDNNANVHPLTDIVVRNWFSSNVGPSALDDFFSSGTVPARFPTKGEIDALINVIESLLRLTYEKFNVGLDFDLLSSEFTPHGINGQGGDEFANLLKYLEIKIEHNKITIIITDPETGITATIMVQFDLEDNLTELDDISPSEPSDITLLAASENKVVVLWNASIDNVGVAGYDVFHDENDSAIGSSPFPLFIHSGLAPDTEYCYTVQAFDASGNKSTVPDRQCIITPSEGENDPPDTPTGLSVNAIGSHGMAVAWTPSQAMDVLGYDIFRQENAVDVKIATTIESSIDELGLQASTEYCYSVQAFDALLNRSVKVGPLCATTAEENQNDNVAPVSSASVSGGTFSSAQNISLLCDDGAGINVNCSVHYTTNGAVPTTSSPVFGGSPLAISSNTTLRFFAKDTAGNVEVPINHEIYVINVSNEDTVPPTVSASPPGGTYFQPQSVTLVCDDGAGSGCNSIYYTFDAAADKSAFLLYTAPLDIGATTTVRYYARDNAALDSDIVSESYEILVDDAPPVSTAIPPGSTYDSPQSVELSCDDGSGSGCADVFYTTNPGATKDQFSQYIAPIPVNADTSLRFYAADNVGNEEPINEESYFIVIPPDTTQPSISSTNFINNGASTTDSLSVSLQLLASDNVGVTAYCVMENDTGTPPAAPAVDDACWTDIIPSTTDVDLTVDYTFSGTYTLENNVYAYLWVRDAVDLVSGVASDSILYSDVIACTTQVDAGLVAGETWNLAGSPYCVNGDIQVSLLTIEAGVEVLVDGPFSISVLSTITAVGNEANPIRFSARQPAEPTSQRWKGIKFQNTPGGSVFSHVIVEYSNDGGVTLENAVPPLFGNCSFQYNTRVGSGGAVRALTGVVNDLHFLNCKFIENSATSHAGALHVAMGGSAQLVIANSEFDANVANYQIGTGDFVGGAVYVQDGNAKIVNSSFTNNVSNSRCVTNFSCTVTGRGGAIYILGSGEIQLENNFISENRVSSTNIGSFCGITRAYGAGIYIASGTVTSINNIYSCNVTQPANCGPSNMGGGIYVNSGVLYTTNDTFARNSTAAALHVAASSTVNISNSIIYNNNANTTQITGNPNVEYSNVQGGFAGTGNIDFNPVFSGVGCAMTDLELVIGSPSIDTGNPATEYDDICFPPSKEATAADMGAYGGPGACGWVDPKISVSPQMLSFGDVEAGVGTVQLTIKITNIGRENLDVGSITVGGADASLFTIVSGNDNCSSQTLQVAESCSVEIEFAPDSVGAKSAEINIPSNDRTSSTAVVSVDGMGI